LKSLERLENIALHPNFGKYVRSIDYDVRMVCSDSVGKGARHWLDRHALQGLNIDEREREKCLTKLENSRLEEHYAAYVAYASGIEYLMRQGHDKRMLLSAINRFPALQGIRCSYPAKMKRITKLSFKQLSPIAQEILEEPSDIYTPEERTSSFWALLDIAFLFKYASQLTDIHVSNASITIWNKLANSKKHDFSTLSALRHLTLGFELDENPREDISTLKLLCAMPSLESLSLSFDSFIGLEPMHLSDLFDQNQHWCNLTALSLKGIITMESNLRHLLVFQAAKLRSLELSNIQLLEGDIAGEFGSWVEFLKFLNENLWLTHVKFDGILHYCDSEIWVTHDYDDSAYCSDISTPTPYPNDCLKYRIERFVTHGAEQFPFYPMPEGVEPGILPEECAQMDIGWMWKPARSWRVHEAML
jgi:hypothetical protein